MQAGDEAEPVLAYGLLFAAAIMAKMLPRQSFFGVAAASLLLLFIGVYNSWDAISYHALSEERIQEMSDAIREWSKPDLAG